MDANKGEAERCLREAEKWVRQNRPVKALKFAKKSHSLFPSQAAQQKIGEITDLLQRRQFEFNAPPGSNPSSSQRRNAPSSASSHPNTNHNHQHPRPRQQEFVQIDPNAVNNNDSSPSLLENVLSFDFWALLFETIFGACFGFIHRLFSPLLPSFLFHFNLRYRRKVWFLLFVVILLSITRFGIIGHPFGAQVYDTQSKPYRYDGDNVKIPYKSHKSHKSYKSQNEFERQKEIYNKKYPKMKEKYHQKKEKNHQKKEKKHRSKQRYDGYNDNADSYSNNYNTRSHGRDSYSGSDRYESYDRTNSPRYARQNRYGTGSSNSFWSGASLFTPSGMMGLFVIGTLLMGMFGNRNREGGNNGINWNMLNMMAVLPMIFGGMPMGGFYGGFGRRRRRGMFGRRRRFF